MEDFIHKLIKFTQKQLELLDEKLRTKLEKIEESYGECYKTLKHLINEDGWCYYSEKDNVEVGAEPPNTHNYDVQFDPPYGYYWRPKSLKL